MTAWKMVYPFIDKKTKKKDYMEHLIKWLGKDDADATWIRETDFKRLSINSTLLNPRMD